eukprot:TRINITY_DN62710_c0_g1_i1.p1 TRINITY_DN62710_c0_g1~~TRINITY_DN62710_c0_g1_i1.p1  ORF type:complete len:362 (-),score=45.49 TRINITY_DN62710_c0_g1_i1:191-1276(-)
MARDLELWLQPAASLPVDCYATVRPIDGKAHSALVPCDSAEGCRLSVLKAGGGPVVVDFFQKVGSVSVGNVEQGSRVEETWCWPGSPDRESAPSLCELRVCLAVLEAAVATAAAFTTAAALVEKVITEPSLVSPSLVPAASPVNASTTPLVNFATAESPEAATRWEPQKPPDKEERRIYKPIALSNCDQIIPNLYLGGVQAAMDKENLVDQGFRAVCCCCRELEVPSSEFSPDLEYYRVDVEDIGREPIELFFPEATEFIHSWVSREQPILVHCRAGVSRSASVVVAYLIEYQGYSLHDAFFLVRSHRSVITPNVGFMEKLGEYEAQHRHTEEPTIEINKYLAWIQASEQDRPAVPDLQPD